MTAESATAVPGGYRPERTGRVPYYIFAAAVVVFLDARGLWHPDEHRYAEIARVMTTPGGDWIVPHLNGNLYPDKPPLFFWIVALLHGGLGIDLALAARLPSIVAGAATVALTWAMGRRLYGPRAALAAAVVLATAVEFTWLARRANLDALMTLFTTFATYGFVRGAFPLPGERPQAALWGVAAFLAVGVGSLAKAPIAIVLAGSVVLAFAAWAREWRTVVAFVPGLLLAAWPVALWLGVAWTHAGEGYVESITIGQWKAHPAGQVDKVQPFWFYAVEFPAAFLPWTLLLPAAVHGLVNGLRNRRRPEARRADLFVACAVAVPLLVLSLSAAKRTLYLLPMLPAAALLTGRLVEDLLSGPAERLRAPLVAWGRFALAGIGLVLGVLAAAGGLSVLLGLDEAVLGRWSAWPELREAAAPWRMALGIFLGAVTAALAWRALRATEPRAAAVSLGTMAVACGVFVGGVALPIADRGISTRPFLESIAARVEGAPLAQYGSSHLGANWILRRDVVPQLQDATAVERWAAKAGASGPVYLLAERKRIERHGAPAGFEVVARGSRVLDDELLLCERPGP